MRIRSLAATFAGVMAATTIGLSAATASATPTGGTIEIWATPGNGAVASIVVTGAIGDCGTATTIDKSGKVDENGDYVKVALKHGGFEVNSVALNQKTNAAPPIMVNNTTCSVEFGGSGPVTLFNGTGMYVGITGTLHITETFAGVSARYATGPKKGQCNMSNNSQPIALGSSITGTGTVEYA